jgi:ferredoxin/flavodoxin---NADP+ reductase
MESSIGSSARPLRVAIIGAGPAGFYAAGALLGQQPIGVAVDLFDRLPTPHGLVRYGVAPDHQKIKSVTKVFDRTSAAAHFRFFGNVTFGRDLTRADLHRFYEAVIYAVGAPSDRRLGIPGEELAGSLSATEFVAWYNGHPDFVELPVDLRVESAVVVGVGNVALDVARILARSVEELAPTDIVLHAEAALATSQIRDIYILSRRGPAQVKFTPAELKEFGELAQADVVIDPAQLVLDPASAAAIANDPEAQRNLDLLRQLAARPLSGKPRRVHFHFLVSPVAIMGDGGRVTAVQIEHNELRANAQGELSAYGTGRVESIPAGLVLRAVGYRGQALPDVPFDARRSVIPNQQGRVVDPATGQVLPGEYVTGWAKRGPTGVIGTNKPDAMETVQQLLADAATLPPAPEPDTAAVVRLLTERGVDFVGVDGWRLIDQAEITAGQPRGKPRLKFTDIAEMFAILQPQQMVGSHP